MKCLFLQKRQRRDAYDCTIFKDPNHHGTHVPGELYMEGDVPSPRMGHSLTMTADGHGGPVWWIS